MRLILLILLLITGCAPVKEERRGGIVSLNPCADQLLIELAPPERIAAISLYSHDPRATSIPIEVARRFRATAGTAEEVLAIGPDLVLATRFTPPATREAFRRAGLKTLYLDAPATLADSRTQIIEVARALGAEGRGRALVERIDAAAARARRDRPVVPALLYISGDMVTGSGTLLDEMMRLSGLENVAGDLGLAHTGTLPIETLIQRPPAVILEPDGGGRSAALRRRVFETSSTPVREFAFSQTLINCGGPTIPAALERLGRIRREAGR